MNAYGIGVALVMVVTLLVAVPLGLKYSQATLLFGFIAAFAAPVVIHRVPDKNWAIALLVALAIFASFPLRGLYQFDGILAGLPVIAAYAAALWVLGLGWKRSWK